MKKIIKLFSICLIIVMLFSFSTGCIQLGGGNPDSGDLPSSEIQAQSIKFNGQETMPEQTLGLVDAIKQVERSVVAVEMQENGSAVSRGSGVIVSVESGKNIDNENVYYVLTCHHVISLKGDIVIYVPDDNCRNYEDKGYDMNYAFKGVIGDRIYSNYCLTLVGGDKESDIAVLRLDVNGKTNKDGNPISIVPAEAVTNSDYSVSKGEQVFAIGNPSGVLPGTVSTGTISYLEREIYLSEVGNVVCHQLNLDTYHGSSGGGLFNMYGQLIGITNAGSDEYSGINYAIPYKISGEEDRGFVNIATQLIGTATSTNYGYISGRWNIGITVNTTYQNGVEIVSVDKNGNADGKLYANDVIRQISYVANGKTETHVVSNVSDFSSVVSDMKGYLKIGDSFKVSVNRPEGFSYRTVNDIEIELKNQFIFCNTNA